MCHLDASISALVAEIHLDLRSRNIDGGEEVDIQLSVRHCSRVGQLFVGVVVFSAPHTLFSVFFADYEECMLAADWSGLQQSRA